ncbi:MAG: hypothetical protein ACYSVY_07195 [Planctomycetota bacterium]|jgi:hypothetical protein
MQAKFLLVAAVLGWSSLPGCGNDASRGRGSAQTQEPESGNEASDDAESSLSSDGGNDEQSSLIADAVTEVQLSPNGKAAALVADPTLVPSILLELTLDPDLAEQNFHNVIDQIYMTRFGQDVDFLIFVIDPSVEAFAPAGVPDIDVTHYSSIRFFDRGIGLDDEVDTSVGSPGLRGYILLARRGHIVNGVALHEIGHAWAAFLKGPPALARDVHPAEDEVADWWGDRRNSHWNNTHVNGIMGGWSDLPGVCDDSERVPYVYYMAPYAPIELYLMGLAGPEEVLPLEVYPDNVYAENRWYEDPLDPWHGGYDEWVCVDAAGDILTQSEFEALTTTVAIEEIIEYNGVRIPPVHESPKAFRVALLVLSTEPLNDDGWDFYERALEFLGAAQERSVRDSFPADRYPDFHSALVDAEEYARGEQRFLNFFMATSGRATIEFINLLGG